MRYESDDDRGMPRLREYFGVLLARRWLVLSVFVLTVGIVAVLTFTRAPLYRATSRLLIESKKPQAVGIREVYEPPDANRDYYETQYRLLRDRQLAERVFEELQAGDRPEYAGLKDPVARFAESIYVEPIRSSRLVDVGFDSTDPVWAGRVANAIVAAYIEGNQQREVGTAERALRELTRQADELEPKFQLCSSAMQEFKERTDLITVEGLEGATNIVLDRLARLNAAATEAELKRISYETEHDATEQFLAEGGEIDALPAVIGSETIQQLTLELAAAEQEQVQIRQKYLPKHPRARAVAGRIDVIRRRLEIERRRILAGRRTELAQARSEEAHLRAALARQKQEAQRLSRLAMQYRVLKDESDRVARLYDVVLDRIKEIDLTNEIARQGSNIFVIHKARVPDQAISPRKRVNMALAIAAGLVLGIGLAFFFEHLDTTIKGQQDVEKTLGLPVLGFVPGMKTNGDGTPVELAGMADTMSPVAEAFRTIRTGITFSAATKKMKRLLVTSASPREGKTVVAVNTAVALARGGAKVLLVDSDMRRPRVHKVLGIRPKTGLATFLVADNNDISLGDVVHSTDVPNMDVVPCDRRPPNPAELLGSPRMKRFVREAVKKYDRIVFDSPPAGRVADASVLSSHADGVVMVVRSFNTDRHLAQRTKEAIEAVDGKIIGVVVNGVDASKRAGYYGYGYYRYGRYHGYGYGRRDEDPHVGTPADATVGEAAMAGVEAGDVAPADARDGHRDSRDLLMLTKGERL